MSDEEDEEFEEQIALLEVSELVNSLVGSANQRPMEAYERVSQLSDDEARSSLVYAVLSLAAYQQEEQSMGQGPNQTLLAIAVSAHVRSACPLVSLEWSIASAEAAIKHFASEQVSDETTVMLIDYAISIANQRRG